MGGDTCKNVFKNGALHNAYKKRVYDVIVIAVLENLLSLKFDPFKNAEFIYSFI